MRESRAVAQQTQGQGSSSALSPGVSSSTARDPLAQRTKQQADSQDEIDTVLHQWRRSVLSPGGTSYQAPASPGKGTKRKADNEQDLAGSKKQKSSTPQPNQPSSIPMLFLGSS